MDKTTKVNPDGCDELSIFRYYARIKGVSIEEAKRIISDTCKRLEINKEKQL
jgi:hypothetical protein